MDAFWTQENIEEKSRAELGADLTNVADLFPRVVSATYVQMTSGDLQVASSFTREEFRRRVLAELPTSCAEVLPFFVRTVWNRKWHPSTHGTEVTTLALAYVDVVTRAGGQLTAEELLKECAASFAE